MFEKNIDLKTGESGVAGGGGKVNICGWFGFSGKTHGLSQKIQAMYFKIQGTYFKICALYFLWKTTSDFQILTKSVKIALFWCPPAYCEKLFRADFATALNAVFADTEKFIQVSEAGKMPRW